MATTPVIGQFSGADVQPWLEDVARLRIEVFRHWPYLYQGDAAYEREYLEAYARSPHSVFVLALDGGGVVGASTGLPLADDEAAFSEPFRAAGMAVDQVFYFGESVLLELERRGIVCSSGSACAAGSDEPSAVLSAMGIERTVAQTALRFSFGTDVTAEALETAATELATAVARMLRLG